MFDPEGSVASGLGKEVVQRTELRRRGKAAFSPRVPHLLPASGAELQLAICCGWGSSQCCFEATGEGRLTRAVRWLVVDGGWIDPVASIVGVLVRYLAWQGGCGAMVGPGEEGGETRCNLRGRCARCGGCGPGGSVKGGCPGPEL